MAPLRILRRSGAGCQGWRGGLAALCLVLAAQTMSMAQPPRDSTPSFAQSFEEAMSAQPDTWVMGATSNRELSGAISGSAPAVPSGNGGFGVNGRLGHITGPAVGRRESITMVELVPFIEVDELWLGGSGRFFRTNEGKYGGSGGAILRRYFPGFDGILGGNVFYDIDDTRGRRFEQLGFGVELLTEFLDIRSNLYFPKGSHQGVIARGVRPGSARFEGNNIFFSTFTTSATAARGVDMLFTVPIPGSWAQRVNLEASAGWYHFSPEEDDIRDLTGARFRLDASFIEKIAHVYIESTIDPVFDNNFVVGVDVNYWDQEDRSPRLGSAQLNRLSQWVERQWTVVTVDGTVVNPGNLAINPNSGNPYVVVHVDSDDSRHPPGGGSGTLDDPYLTIQDAQTLGPAANPEGDVIIFVHAGSVFNDLNMPGGIVMNPNERILGEGVSHPLAVQGFNSTINLPGTGEPGGVPVIDNITGVPVQLADNVEFGGFQITNTTNGPAIFADNINRATIRGVVIDTVVNGSGIVINDSSGTIAISNTEIRGADDDAFVISGGNATVRFTDGEIVNDTNRAVRIDAAAGGFNFGGSTIEDTGTGILVNAFTGTGTFNTAELTGGTFDVIDSSGDIGWLNSLEITSPVPNPENPGGVAIQILNYSGTMTFGPSAGITITDRSATGILFENLTGTFVSLGNTQITTGSAGGLSTPGVDFGNSSGQVAFQGLAIDGGSAGIVIGGAGNENTAGAEFAINGLFNIQNTTSATLGAISVFDDADVFTNGGTISSRGGYGILVDGTSGNLTFGGVTNISNELLVGIPAVDIQDATGPVNFGSLNVTGALGPAPGVNVDNSGDVGFGLLSVEYIGTAALDEFAVNITDSGAISIGGGFLNATNAGAINLDGNTSISATLTRVDASSDNVGIQVINNPGSFTVTGTGGVGTGGTITGMAVAGGLFDYNGFNPLSSANRVQLGGMTIANNFRGIFADELNRVTLDDMTITTSAREGVLILDTVNVTVTDSSFVNNGTARIVGEQEHLEILNGIDPDPSVDTVFTYLIERNTFTDGAGANFSGDSMVEIGVTGAGIGTILDLSVQDNGPIGSGITGFIARREDATLGNNGAALSVRWDGEIRQAVIENNSFQLLGGDGQTGIVVVNGSTTDTSSVFVNANTIVTNAADNAIGGFFEFAGRADLAVTEHRLFDNNNNLLPGLQMNGEASQGFSISMGSGASNLLLENNFLEFNADDGIGFNFPFTNGTPTFVINNNIVNHNTNLFINFAPGERGFDFGPIVGTINFVGSQNNFVNFGLQDFFSVDFPTLPPGSFTGSILVNGRQVP